VDGDDHPLDHPGIAGALVWLPAAIIVIATDEVWKASPAPCSAPPWSEARQLALRPLCQLLTPTVRLHNVRSAFGFPQRLRVCIGNNVTRYSPRLSLTSSSLMPRYSWPAAGIVTGVVTSPIGNGAELPTFAMRAPAKFFGSGAPLARR
jgi:hypothetical protein